MDCDKTEEIKKTVSERINALMGEEYNDRQIAELAGIDRSLVQKLRSQQRIPTVEAIIRLSKAFGTSTDYLLGLSDDHDKKPTAVDELKITVDAKEALKKIASRHPTDREALSTFIESDEFSDLIGHFRALQTTINTYQQLTAPYLISRYGYSPGESIEDPINQLRILRLEIEDCITHYLESEYHYSEIKKDLQNNIDLALAAIEAEEENSDGIT